MEHTYETPASTSKKDRTFEVMYAPSKPEKRSSNRCLMAACVVGVVVLSVISVIALILVLVERKPIGDSDVLVQDLKNQLSDLKKLIYDSDHHFNETVMKFTQSDNQLNETNEKFSELKKQIYDSDRRLSETVMKLEQSDRQLNNTSQRLTAVQDKLNQAKLDLNSRISSLHAKPVPVTCPDTYLLNPYSNTCYGLVRDSLTWQQAKSHCEFNGGYLATFETLESASWFLNQRSTRTAWGGFNAWIGGQRGSDGMWRWYGRTTGMISFSFWASDEPSNDRDIENCLESQLFNSYQGNDAPCSNNIQFFCEKA